MPQPSLLPDRCYYHQPASDAAAPRPVSACPLLSDEAHRPCQSPLARYMASCRLAFGTGRCRCRCSKRTLRSATRSSSIRYRLMYWQFTTTASPSSVIRSSRLSRCVVKSRSPRWLDITAGFPPNELWARRRHSVGRQKNERSGYDADGYTESAALPPQHRAI